MERRLQEVSKNYKQFDERFLGERQKQEEMQSRLAVQQQTIQRMKQQLQEKD